MAISLTHQSDNSANNPGTSHTLPNVTVGSGANRYMLLLCMWEDDNNETLTPVWDPATANQSLTRIGIGYFEADDAQTSAYGLIAPDTGTDKNIVIGIDPSLGAGGFSCAVFVLEGVDQDTPVRDEDGMIGDFDEGTAYLTGLTSGDFIAGGMSNENSGTSVWTGSTITMTEVLDVQQGASTLSAAYGTADSATEDIVCTMTILDHAAMGAWAIVPAVGGEDFFRSATDTVGITDSLTTAVGVVIGLTESEGITDALSLVAEFFRTEADNVGITDTTTTSVGVIKSITDTLGITDTLTTIVGKMVTFADTVGITDVITTSVGRIVALADTIGITDALTKIGTFIKSVSDTVGITDVISLTGTYIRDITDAVGITDVLSISIQYVRAVADAVGITDVVTTLVTMVVTLIDTVGITDAISTLVARFVSIVDTVGITDTISKTVQFVRTIADTTGITDVLTKIGTYIRSLTDPVGITDTVSPYIYIIVRPDGDISVNNWTDELGGTTNIYQSIDETIPDDNDYIASPYSPSSEIYECSLENVDDPQSSAGHIIKYRYKKIGSATIDLTVKLMQGAVEKASWIHYDISTSVVLAEQTLTSGQADSITDYSDLRLRFEAVEV